MLVFDFSVGAGKTTSVFKDAGDEVHAWNINVDFYSDDTQAFMRLKAEDLLQEYGRPDFVWASPPCVAFSPASLHRHWIGGRGAFIPGTPTAENGIKMAQQVADLIDRLDPTLGFIIENPRGVLRKLDVLKHYEIRTVHYCSYGDFRMKPTDLWGTVPGWIERPRCIRGAPCHEAAPRGSRSGTMGLKKGDRATIPPDLPLEIREALLNYQTIINKNTKEQ